MMGAGQPRWLLSFADLLMLLLGFFVMLGASRADPAAVSAGMREAFGADPRPAGTAERPVLLDPATLFEPGEAVLRPGRAGPIAAIGARYATRRITLVSSGEGAASGRLDRFELAAARAAAFARALGLPPGAITIEMRGGDPGHPQRIAITPSR